MQPGGIAPARRCGRHKLVLRPDGTCVVCEREGGPFASDISGLRGRSPGGRTLAPTRPAKNRGARRGLWAGLGVVFGLVGGIVLWLQLTDGAQRPGGSSYGVPKAPEGPTTVTTPAGELPAAEEPGSARVEGRSAPVRDGAATNAPETGTSAAGAQKPAAQEPTAQEPTTPGTEPSSGASDRPNPLLDARQRALEEAPRPGQPYPAGSNAP